MARKRAAPSLTKSHRNILHLWMTREYTHDQIAEHTNYSLSAIKRFFETTHEYSLYTRTKTSTKEELRAWCKKEFADENLGNLDSSLNEYVTRAYVLKLNSPNATLRWAKEITPNLQAAAATENDLQTGIALRETILGILTVQHIAQREMLLSDKMDQTDQTSTDMFDEAKQLEDLSGSRLGFGLAHSQRGDARNIQCIWVEAVDDLYLALHDLPDEPVYQLRALRPLALALARLWDKKAVDTIADKIYNIVGMVLEASQDSDEPLEEACEALEGVALAYYELKSDEGVKFMQKALEIRPQIYDAPRLRDYQLRRTWSKYEPVLSKEQKEMFEPLVSSLVPLPLLLNARSPYKRHLAQLRELA